MGAIAVKQDTRDETQLIRYLLAQMDEDEQAQIEERYVADPEFHQEVRAAERDLIDQYVHGELSNPKEFETKFLSSLQRRQKVEFARALRQSLAESSVAGDSAVSDRERGLSLAERLRFFTSSSGGWQLAAATVVILFIGGWLLVSWRDQTPTSQVAETPPGQPVQGSPGAASPVPGPEVPAPSRPEVPPIRVATFVLLPSLTRNSDETPTLTIARDVDVDVRLQLSLEPGDYDTYRVVIRTADGDEIWRQDGLKTVRASSGEALVITLPGARFSDREYTIRVGGVSAGGEVEETAGYYFRVLIPK
jgi:anti-sigma factor RsiW